MKFIYFLGLILLPITLAAMKPAGLGAETISDDIVQRFKETRGNIRQYDSLSVMQAVTFHLASDMECCL